MSVNQTTFEEFAKSLTDQALFNSVIDWVTFFEKEYDCAGLCTPSAFGVSRSIESGPASKSCLQGIKDSLTSAFMGLGVSTLLAGIMLFFLQIWQYCFWKKYKK